MSVTSRLVLTLASTVAALVLHGCGSGGGGSSPTPGPSPGPSPSPTPGPSPPESDSYDGSPPFMLEDKGMKAFSYNPLYLAQPKCLDAPGSAGCTSIINDDVSAEWGEMMWSAKGRGDIKTIATFGANAIRLYGNDPRFSKRKFFDELLSNNMKAVTGMSNYPFTNQDDPQGCIWTNAYDCYQVAKDNYAQLLKTGEFAQIDGYYHNAIEIVSIMNEPDIHAWLPGQWTSENNYIKALVTAFDAMLTAEKEANIKPWKSGKSPKITVAWSYATLQNTCPECCAAKGYIKDPSTECGPGIGFEAQLYYAIHDPNNTVKYTPVNDLKAAYKERWIHSIQPFNPTSEVYAEAIKPSQVLNALKGHKMYFGEFDPAVNSCHDKPSCDNYGTPELEHDLKVILTDPDWTKSVIGASFFQFQQAYNKNSAHEACYGMFAMTPDAPWKTGYIEGDAEKDHPINCLKWKTKDLGEAVAAAFGGKVPELHCPTDLGADDLVV